MQSSSLIWRLQPRNEFIGAVAGDELITVARRMNARIRSNKIKGWAATNCVIPLQLENGATDVAAKLRNVPGDALSTVQNSSQSGNPGRNRALAGAALVLWAQMTLPHATPCADW
jgi:hypothetical protein